MEDFAWIPKVFSITNTPDEANKYFVAVTKSIVEDPLNNDRDAIQGIKVALNEITQA